MEIKINNTKVLALQGDITLEKTDAIVNAANTSLRGGGGVDGAIHRAGGPVILEECKKYDGCPTGEVRTTSGGNLKARYVIHTVGPIYKKKKEDAILLGNCYTNALFEAARLGIQSIAFPSISTGVYGYPIEDASVIALNSIKEFLTKENQGINEIHIVLFSKNNLDIYSQKLKGLICQ